VTTGPSGTERRCLLFLRAFRYRPPMRCRLGFAAVLALAVPSFGCDTDATQAPPSETFFTITTDELVVASGAEKYLCFAQTLDRDLVVDRFVFTKTEAVHHLLLAKNTIPEADGLSECDVLFRNSWIPLFGAGNGDATLEAPAGNGHVIPKGTQLLVQLHMLNASSAEVRTPVSVQLREAASPDVQRVGIYAFGTNDISLAPKQPGEVSNDCTVEKDLDVFAWWPHMHELGTSLTLAIGPDEASLQEVYRVDPWDFDDQTMVPSPLHIPKGSFSRVTCAYDNPSPDTIGFGESSNDEMCFLMTFASDAQEELDGCVYLVPSGEEPVPPDPAAGTCGEQQANALGIGATCTKGGGECADGLSCSMDQGSEAPGFCLKVGGCEVTADCGGDWATCCAPKEAGGLLNICIPEACRPADCYPQ
jgi:hypothetical protein